MQPKRFSIIVFVVVSALLALAWIALRRDETTAAVTIIVSAVLLIIIAAGVLTGQQLKKATVGKVLDVEYFRETQTFAKTIQAKQLDPHTKAEKESRAREIQKQRPLPGDKAPRFSAVLPPNASDLLIRPSAYPMTPMYLLDNAFRILDWNEAFTIAFDRTMEGRKGRGVLEWTYFLDNYEEVLDHGVRVFADPQNLPVIDIEPISFTSQRYGSLSATKRAYRIPDDSGACLAWLVTLDIRFEDPKQEALYKQDVIRVLGADLMWSEYAISYDRVLNSTAVYPELLETLIGNGNGVRKIPEDARILDLGAGTGNLTYRLITKGRDRVVFAAENNRIMLEFLRSKCNKFLRTDPNTGGVVAFKQDITSLFGLEDNYFDFAVLNNVLYAVHDANACLEEVCRVLKPGGELRLSGPRKDTDLSILFGQIETELKEANSFQELESDYNHVMQINKLRLSPWLYRWTTKDVQDMIRHSGFSEILYTSEKIYAEQSMFICAKK